MDCHVSSILTFIDDSGLETIFDPPLHGGSIRWIAAKLAATFPPGGRIGLLYRTEPNLILAWFACITAGFEPLVLQYPTRKQPRNYWMASVNETIGSVQLGGIVADKHCTEILDTQCSTAIVSQTTLDNRDCQPHGEVLLPEDFAIIQLSSGTTGFRKPIRFSSLQLRRHVQDYNAVLSLTTEDRLVSWLPLSHDMGYIACLVMPILLDIDVVMMDPMTWIQRPELLFEAIERHRSTLCYMPNFGFEIMSRIVGHKMPSMRRWVSCSEPISAATSLKFISQNCNGSATFSPCYAMAENVFAVTISGELKLRMINDIDVVSCGRPIEGVQVKIVDGEIRVKSNTSIVQYFEGPDIRDDSGFYPTGDLGDILDGELFVLGRKQDLLIQAGRKFVLSDIDLRLNELFPEIRGRAATLAMRDERIGTESPLVLIEAPDFFSRSDGQAIATRLREAVGLDQIQVEFVPPRFLTKTSSGKINRSASRNDWLAVKSASGQGDESRLDPVAELHASFVGVDWDRSISETLDSLSRTILRIILDSAGVPLDDTMNLTTIERLLAASQKATSPRSGAEEEVGIRIVSMADRDTLGRLTQQHLHRIEEVLGCRVTLEHVCLPPSPITFSDLIFHDYFRPRLDPEPFAYVSFAMHKLKNASIIIADDMAELAFLYESTYPALSHLIERDRRADLVSFRWQQYTRSHDKLPLSIVGGVDIPLSAASRVLGELEHYLETPIFRIATISGFRDFTKDWDYQSERELDGAVDPDKLSNKLLFWLGSLGNRLKRQSLPKGQGILVSDLSHFCSHMVRKSLIDMVLNRFESFCIAGQTSSVPYVAQEIERLGKRYIRVPSHAPEILGNITEQFDCLLLCGPVGDPVTDLPVVAFQHAGVPWLTRNLGEFGKGLPHLVDMPASGSDWFHNFELKPLQDYKVWSGARLGLRLNP